MPSGSVASGDVDVEVIQEECMTAHRILDRAVQGMAGRRVWVIELQSLYRFCLISVIQWKMGMLIQSSPSHPRMTKGKLGH